MPSDRKDPCREISYSLGCRFPGSLVTKSLFTIFQFKKYFEKKLEIKTIKHASAITTVSQPLADKLAELHENKQIYRH